jgi:hypothetical protein
VHEASLDVGERRLTQTARDRARGVPVLSLVGVASGPDDDRTGG